jgi:hypothetical protein
VDDALSTLNDEYIAIVVNDRDETSPDLDVEHVLDVYDSFHLLERATTWGKVPLQCTCVHFCRDCKCKHCTGTRFASIFDSDLQVPSDYAAEPSLRKKYHKIKGTAVPKRQRLLQAARADKKQKESMIKYIEIMEG